MPFLGAIGAAIGGALSGIGSFLAGGTLLSKVLIAGLSIAAQYAIGSLTKKKQDSGQQQATAKASQLETRYGETQPRQVLLGMVGTAGHHVYRNAYGAGNRIVQDVYRLADFRIHRVTRVRFDGLWRDLGGTEDTEKGFRIQGIGNAEVWVKVYTGTMSQTADAGLINRSNPAGRWTSAHKGAGVAYAIVTSVLTREYLQQPWQAFFEVEGAPLYDWRLDSTVGGSGSHRWSDQATWEWSDNPVLMMYALERGFHAGSELIVGKGVDASRLPLAEWTIAANICDESISGEARYRAGCIVTSGAGVTHDANMQPLLESCAASWVEIIGEEYPLVGAAQSISFEFTDDDIVPGERFRWSAKRTRSELVNTVAATFVSPDAFYQSAPLATRIDASALSADRERIAVSIGYGAVTSSVVGDRLADIAIRASRYQGSAELCLRPKFLGVKPGEWGTWASARFGWTKTFQVTSKQLGAFGGNSARNVYLSLQEVDEGIFDPTAYATLPPDAVGQGEPDYQVELANFIVAPYVVLNEEGRAFAAIRVSWDAITDPTVVGIELFWRPVNQPEAVLSMTLSPDQTVAVLANGIISETLYEVSYRLISRPARINPQSDWEEVTTPNVASDILVGLANMQSDARNFFRQLASRYQTEFRAIAERLALDTALGAGSNRQEIASVTRTTSAQAIALLALETAINDDETGLSALATAILGVEVQVEDLAAGGRISFRAQIPPPDGVLAQIDIMARASDSDSFVQSGIVIQVYLDGSTMKSRIMMLTDKFIITDGSLSGFPFVFENGTLTLNSMRAKTLTAGRLQSADGSSYVDLGASPAIYLKAS